MKINKFICLKLFLAIFAFCSSANAQRLDNWATRDANVSVDMSVLDDLGPLPPTLPGRFLPRVRKNGGNSLKLNAPSTSGGRAVIKLTPPKEKKISKPRRKPIRKYLKARKVKKISKKAIAKKNIKPVEVKTVVKKEVIKEVIKKEGLAIETDKKIVSEEKIVDKKTLNAVSDKVLADIKKEDEKEAIVIEETKTVVKKEVPEFVNKKTEGVDLTIFFDSINTDVSDENISDLSKIANWLKKDENLRLMLFSYASKIDDEPNKALFTSLTRALKIRKFLIKQDVRGNRITIKSKGDKVDFGNPDRVDLIIK